MNKNRVYEPRKTFSRKNKDNRRQNFPPFQELNSEHTRDFRHPKPHLRHQNLKQSDQARRPFFHPDNYHCQDSYNFNPCISQRRPHRFAVNPLRDSHLTPFSESREFNQCGHMYNAYPHFTQVPESRRFEQVLRRKNVHPQLYTSPLETKRWR